MLFQNQYPFYCIPFFIITLILILAADIAAAQWQRYHEVEVLNTAKPTVEWNKYNDKDTGHEIWQMTSSNAGTWHGHFNTISMTPDDRYLVFSSERTGSWQLYRASLENGEILQLTDVESLSSSSFTVHPNGKEVYFGFDGKLGRANITTGEIYKAEFDVPIIFRRLISNNGQFTVVTHTDEHTTIFLISLSEPEVKAKLQWPRGSTLKLPEYEASGLQWTGGISHTMMNPEYPWLVTFLPRSNYRDVTQYFDKQRDMSLPMNMRARAWLWDARTGEARPFVSAPYYYSYTHESWGWTGERFYFFLKSAPGWVPNHISSVNKEGNDLQYHHSDDTLRLGHGASSHDGKWFISDGQDPGRNPLRLINLKTGKWEDLAWPDAAISGADGASGHSIQAHVHPSFSPSGNFVTYTGNPTGEPGDSEAYVIPIPAEVKDRLK